MNEYSLRVEADVQQFEKELRNAIDETPTGDTNRMFLLEGATPDHRDRADIVMTVVRTEIHEVVLPKGTRLGSFDPAVEPIPEDKPRRVREWSWPIEEEVRPAIECRYFEHAPPVMRVSVVCVDERVADYCGRLVQELDRRFPGAWQRPEDVDKPAANIRKPTEKTRLRAAVFKRLKDAHPEWGYDAVAQKANDELITDTITAETVRNAYKAMGWTWERADRIR